MTGTLPVSGPISLDTVRSTFGLTGSLALSQLYRGGAIIPNGPSQNANVPTSGPISLSDLYGATDVASPAGFTFAPTISGNTQGYNLATAASAAGWNGTEPLFATVTINGGVVVGSSSTGAYAFTIPSLPANSTVTLVNNGYIVGMGGNGGAGGTANYGQTTTQGMTGGSGGGPALLCQYPTTLQGGGIIGGGGGGGGGGQGWYGSQNIKSGPTNTVYFYADGGGGGGAGAGNNTGSGGGGGGYGKGTLTTGNFSGANGGGGGGPSTTGGGAGGAHGTAGPSAAVNGGAGGSLGNAGGTGTDGGGAPGHAINGSGNISFQWSGTVYGPVS